MKRILILALIFFALFVAISSLKFGKVTGQGGFLESFLESSSEERQLLLPDMVPTAPLQIYITTLGGRKELHFSTTFYNQGKGALEIIGHTDKEKEITYASQYIFEDEGPGIYKDIGNFVYHPGHSHWHVNNYVFYQLWTVGSDGKPDERLISTDKMSFCIWDEFSKDLSLENAPKSRVFTRTCYRETQGMSVGWADTYSATVEGQEVDITEIPDGTYIFRTVINPDRKIEEENYDNDQTDITIEIKGNRLIRK